MFKRFMGTEEEVLEIRADLEQEVATTFIERAQQRAAQSGQSATAGRYGGNQHVCQCSQASVRSCNQGNQSCGGNQGNHSCGGGSRSYQNTRQCCCSKLLRFIPPCSCNTTNQGKLTNQTNQDNDQKPSQQPRQPQRLIKRSISAPQQPSRTTQRSRRTLRALEPRHYSISPVPTAPPVTRAVEQRRISSPTFNVPSLPAVANSASTLPRKALFRTRGEWNMYERPLITTIPSSSYRINSSLSELCSSIKVVRKAVPCTQCTTNNQQYMQYMQNMPVQGSKEIELNIKEMFDAIPDISEEESPPVLTTNVTETHKSLPRSTRVVTFNTDAKSEG